MSTAAPAAVIEAPGMRIQFLIEGDQTNDAISIFRCDFEAGARVPMPHSHDGFDETVYVLSGELTAVIDGVPQKVQAGDVIHVPRGVVHGFEVRDGASILAISTPGLFGSAYFLEMADALNAAGDAPPGPRPAGRDPEAPRPDSGAAGELIDRRLGRQTRTSSSHARTGRR